MLLFPIDDKQSRLDGQDQVSSVEMKLLPGNASFFRDVSLLFSSNDQQCDTLCVGLCVATEL